MRVLVLLADGCEEMEAVILIDVLRRANWEVTATSIESQKAIRASRGVGLEADVQFDEVDYSTYDLLVLPGGLGGVERLAAHAGVLEALAYFDTQKKWIGAICAAAVVLSKAGVLEHRAFTCYPSIEQELPEVAAWVDQAVVIDAHLITAQGPGSAFEFALTLIAQIADSEQAASVRAALLL